MSRLRSIVVAAPLEVAPYGLLNPAFSVHGDSEGRWENGFSLESEACNVTVKNKDLCDATNVVTVVNLPRDQALRSFDQDPIVVEVTDGCSTFGLKPQDRMDRLERQLEAATQFALEREFWTGAVARAATPDLPNRYLASTTATDVTPTPGTPVKAKFGLALLEGAINSSGIGTVGTIHADRGTASVLPLKDVDGVLKTTLGNTVVAGSGYTGSGPTGAAPTGSQKWMYATGPVMVQLGRKYFTPDSITQAIDVKINDVALKAERAAAATWDGCHHYAVLVDLSLDYA